MQIADFNATRRAAGSLWQIEPVYGLGGYVLSCRGPVGAGLLAELADAAAPHGLADLGELDDLLDVGGPAAGLAGFAMDDDEGEVTAWAAWKLESAPG